MTVSTVRLTPWLLVLSGCPALAAQQPPPLTVTIAAERHAELQPKVPATAWIPGTRHWSMVVPGASPDQPARVEAFAEDGSRTFLFDAAAASKALEAAGLESLDRLTIPEFTWLDPRTLRFAREDGIYHWTFAAPVAQRVLEIPAGALATAAAPGDELVAVVTKDHQLELHNDHGGVQILTTDGSPDVRYGQAAHRSEFGIHSGLLWDGYGRRLAFTREDLGAVSPYPHVDFGHLPPRAVADRYPMAGGTNSRVTVGIYDTDDRTLRYLEQDPDQDLYWTNLAFAVDGSFLLVALVSRDQKSMRLVQFDSRTGKQRRVLLEESSAIWVEPSAPPILLPDASGRFLWFSARDGFRHLYLHDDEGRLVRQLTKGPFDVIDCVGFRRDLRMVFVHAAGPDPRQTHFFAVEMGGGGMRQLTSGRGTHHCVPSPLGDRVLDTHSSLVLPMALDLLDLEMGEVERITTAPDPLKGFTTGRPEFFEVTATDGTILHGLRILPPGATGQDGSTTTVRHPLLLYVYGGPQVQLVVDRHGGGLPPWLHAFAAEGYVVAAVDPRGSDRRGLAFAQSVFRRLGSHAVEDQLAALDALVALPYVDPERVAVHGWSFGGYLTLRLLMAAPERFRCGVAGAPVVDWHQYETGWTERYLESPEVNPKGYAEADLRPRLGALQAPVLVAFGADDRTVVFSHLTSLLRAAVEQGVFVDTVLYPTAQHGLKGKDRVHFLRRLQRFLDGYLVRAG